MKKKKKKLKAVSASADVNQRPVAISIVHVNTPEHSGNSADQDLKRLLKAGNL